MIQKTGKLTFEPITDPNQLIVNNYITMMPDMVLVMVNNEFKKSFKDYQDKVYQFIFHTQESTYPVKLTPTNFEYLLREFQEETILEAHLIEFDLITEVFKPNRQVEVLKETQSLAIIVPKHHPHLSDQHLLPIRFDKLILPPFLFNIESSTKEELIDMVKSCRAYIVQQVAIKERLKEMILDNHK